MRASPPSRARQLSQPVGALSNQMRGRMLTEMPCRYSDSEYEYRHVQLPKQMLKVIPKEYFDGSRGTLKLLWEEEWRALGITQVGPPF